ncbi:uncharacterized protein LOC119454528 [Dermacentor silvarum]|uniref:uncharacterized protein LOC119454528 n=1 Tax=Dermacentor silvarum TaxID=543639 RepID=UPI0018996E0A|nr:uncharacterized protein LOC119454528 [Dermacentor silvarum]
MLSMYVDLEHKTWDAILSYATFAYNTAVQETTQVTPFQLVYGRIVRTTLDAILPVDADNNNPYDVDDFLQRAEEAHQLARFRIRQQQRRDASYYNLRRREVQYQPGDQVKIKCDWLSIVFVCLQAKAKGVEHLIEVQNPNRVEKKPKKVAQLNEVEEEAPQLSRREREELEKQRAKQHYQKMHAAGKTEEARADLARLALIRKQREEQARKKEEEIKAKEAERKAKAESISKALGKKT